MLTYDQDIKLAGPADIAVHKMSDGSSLVRDSGAVGDFSEQSRQSSDPDQAAGQLRPVLKLEGLK
jgi:hypothetical protein